MNKWRYWKWVLLLRKKILEAGMVVHTFSSSVQETGLMDLCEFWASQDYIKRPSLKNGKRGGSQNLDWYV